MQAHEAIQILESLDPSTEVTLTIGRATKMGGHGTPLPGYTYPHWVIKDNTWPARPFEVTCKPH